MTDVARDHESGAEGDGPQASYEFPRRLTTWGRAAVEKAVHDFVADLAASMDRHTHHAADLTDRDVETALIALGRGRLRPVHSPTGTRSSGRLTTMDAGLVTVGTAGVSTMGSFLHSTAQIVLLLAFVVIGLTGLVLTWVHATRSSEKS